jgi:hypothetical protein
MANAQAGAAGMRHQRHKLKVYMWINAPIGEAGKRIMAFFVEKRRTKMTYDSDMSRMKWVIGGAAVGALTMFLLDPDRGNRRRALAKDKMHSAVRKTRKEIDAKSRDLANRAKGLGHEVTHIFSSPQGSSPS